MTVEEAPRPNLEVRSEPSRGQEVRDALAKIEALKVDDRVLAVIYGLVARLGINTPQEKIIDCLKLVGIQMEAKELEKIMRENGFTRVFAYEKGAEYVKAVSSIEQSKESIRVCIEKSGLLPSLVGWAGYENPEQRATLRREVQKHLTPSDGSMDMSSFGQIEFTIDESDSLRFILSVLDQIQREEEEMDNIKESGSKAEVYVCPLSIDEVKKWLEEHAVSLEDVGWVSTLNMQAEGWGIDRMKPDLETDKAVRDAVRPDPNAFPDA